MFSSSASAPASSNCRANLGLKWSVLIVCLQVPGLYLGVTLGGTMGVAVAFAILQVITLVLNYLILVRTLLGPCLKDYLASMAPALAMSATMGAVVYAVGQGFSGLPSWILLGLQTLLGAALYGGMLWLFRRPFLIDLRTMIAKKRAA